MPLGIGIVSPMLRTCFTTSCRLLEHIWENGGRERSPFPGERVAPASPGKRHLSSSEAILPFPCPPTQPLLLQQQRGWQAMAFILFFAALRKKRISEGFEHSSLNSSLELRDFPGDYLERLPLAGGRGWQVLGRRRGREKAGVL